MRLLELGTAWISEKKNCNENNSVLTVTPDICLVWFSSRCQFFDFIGNFLERSSHFISPLSSHSVRSAYQILYVDTRAENLHRKSKLFKIYQQKNILDCLCIFGKKYKAVSF